MYEHTIAIHHQNNAQINLSNIQFPSVYFASFKFMKNKIKYVYYFKDIKKIF